MTVRFSLWIVLRMDVVYCSKTNAFVGMLQGIWLAALLVGYLFQRVTCQFGVPGDCVRAVRAIAVVELYLSSFLYEMDFIFEFTAVPGVVELHVQQQLNTRLPDLMYSIHSVTVTIIAFSGKCIRMQIYL